MRLLDLACLLALLAPAVARADDPPAAAPVTPAPAAPASAAPAPVAPEAAPAAPAPTSPDEVIVVTGLRLPRPLRDVPAAVTVVDRDQIDQSPDTMADDLVRTVPTVGAFRRSSSLIADPTSQGVNLRGVGPSGVSRALVLRDGILVNDPFGGWVYWRALTPLGIDRVEVVPSGGSALFGNFALGGVMQVLSRPITGAAVDAIVAGGSLGTERFAARGTERFGDIGVEIVAESLHTSGYNPIVPSERGAIDHNASSTDGAASARVEYAHADNTLHATVRGFTESLDAGTDHTTADVKTLTYEAGWQLQHADSTLDVQLFGGNQLFEQERARVSAGRATAASAAEQRTPSNNQGAVATWTGQVADQHAIVVGLDTQRVAGTATDSLTPPTVMPTTLVQREAGGEQRFLGAFAQDAAQLTPAIQIAAALRLDGWQNLAAGTTTTTGNGVSMTTPFADRSDLQLDPRLGALVHITHELSLRASGYRGFRAPTLNELYRPFQVGTVLTLANADLKPETLWGGEGGAELAGDTYNLQLTGFWNRLSDPIANVTLAMPVNGATRERENLGATRIFGVDLDLVWRPADAWMVRAGEMFSDAHVTEAPSQPTLVGKRLAQDPQHRATAAVTYDNPQIATVTAQIRYLGSMFEDDQNTQPIGAVILVDARVERAIAEGFSLFVSGLNLTDRQYLVGRAGIDTQGAPRTFELGITYHAAAKPH